ncbi:ArnT family glycosyltransferase [Paraburkholderia hospita]|uniref:ArnT family glycosyltransferase n=1 Tax=Paraburkholderia hospita TaxID=169430 RepID=UPI000B344ED8|nr:hypothetical protein [Paraburkholderia hospita]OUL82351.1 hypothetical protein CA603_28570 [Paraburkholderia hospita]
MESPNKTQYSIVAILVSLVVAGAIAWTLVGFARYSMIAPPGFDGAMNLKTAASLVRGDGYGFFYDRFFPFPAQTDGPFILPTALAFWLGGITPFTGQVVNLLYIAALIILLTVLLSRLNTPLWLALLAVLASIAMPGFVDYSMNGYGEVPVLAWFFSAVLVLVPRTGNGAPSRARLTAAGVLFGVAYLTKVVALVCVAPAMLILTCVVFCQPDRKGRLIALYIGAVVPVLLWELFRLVEVGSAHAYVNWWRYQVAQIRAQSGAKNTGAVEGFLAKGAHHLSILSDMTGVPAAVLAIGIVVPVFVGLLLALDKRTRSNTRLVLAVLVTVVSLYFFWWMFISPTAMTWLRRILDGLVLLQCLVVVALVAAWTRRPGPHSLSGVREPRGNVVLVVVLIPAIACSLMLARNGESLTRPPQVPDYALNMYKMADTVRALPADATIFGTGWWQAPVVSLFSGRRFENFEHWRTDRINAAHDKYFVTDMYTEGISQSSIQKVLDVSDHEQVVKMTGGALYKLNKVRAYSAFTADDMNVANLANGLNFSVDDYSHRRGSYSRESNKEAWVGLEAAVMFKRKGENTLTMSIDLPSDLIDAASTHRLRLQVSSPGCLDRVVELSKPGEQTIKLPLACDAWTDAQPFLVTLSSDQQVPFIPQIDSDNRLRAFKLRSMQLTVN